MGHARFLAFYLLCGLGATLGHVAMDPESTLPMIGASGAISGVLGGYILLHPAATVRVFIFLGFFITVARVPAWIVLGVWFLLQLISAASASASEPGVAFMAHIGGFVAGFVLISLFKRREIPILEPRRHKPFQIERRRGPWG